MNFDFSYVFIGFFVFVLGAMLFNIIRHRGLKGWLFGAQIVRTLGEVSGAGAKPMTTLLRVHTLAGGGADKTVGIEFVAKSFASYQMMPFSLSVAETKKLISLLESAVHGR